MPLPRARVYRDPVHDIISFKEEGELGRIVAALVDTPEVQRLRFVRQLGMANLVFHGAEHSRFAHSMGVAHLSRRMVHRLGPAIDAETRIVVVCAALLHDIGHAPFSHVMERVFDFSHEDWSEALVRDPESGVHRVLAGVDPTLPDAVANCIRGQGPAAATAIVSSQLDADRADYLLRDAHMTGVQVGRYDLERILLMLRADEDGLCVDVRAYEAVEGYLIARYHMYRLVYFHRAVRGAESMLKALFGRARQLMEAGDSAMEGEGALGALMRRERPTSGDWARLRDFHAWALIDRWQDHPDPILSRLAGGLLNRRLLRGVERDVESPATIQADDDLVARIRAELAPAESWLFHVDDAGDAPYRPYLPREGGRGGIRIRARDGRVSRIEELSPVVGALADAAYRIRRWYIHPDLVGRLRTIVGPQQGF